MGEKAHKQNLQKVLGQSHEQFCFCVYFFGVFYAKTSSFFHTDFGPPCLPATCEACFYWGLFLKHLFVFVYWVEANRLQQVFERDILKYLVHQTPNFLQPIGLAKEPCTLICSTALSKEMSKIHKTDAKLTQGLAHARRRRTGRCGERKE